MTNMDHSTLRLSVPSSTVCLMWWCSSWSTPMQSCCALLGGLKEHCNSVQCMLGACYKLHILGMFLHGKRLQVLLQLQPIIMLSTEIFYEMRQFVLKIVTGQLPMEAWYTYISH